MNKHGLLFSMTLWALIAYAVTGCTVSLSTDWHGETGVTKTVATGLAKDSKKDDRRY